MQRDRRQDVKDPVCPERLVDIRHPAVLRVVGVSDFGQHHSELLVLA